MDSSGTDSAKELHVGLDPTTEEEYATQSKLLQEFINIPSIDKAWIFNSDSGNHFCIFKLGLCKLRFLSLLLLKIIFPNEMMFSL